MTDAERRMLAMIEAQHKALYILMERLIVHDDKFFPSKSIVWPTVESARALIERCRELDGQRSPRYPL